MARTRKSLNGNKENLIDNNDPWGGYDAEQQDIENEPPAKRRASLRLKQSVDIPTKGFVSTAHQQGIGLSQKLNSSINCGNSHSSSVAGMALGNAVEHPGKERRKSNRGSLRKSESVLVGDGNADKNFCPRLALNSNGESVLKQTQLPQQVKETQTIPLCYPTMTASIAQLLKQIYYSPRYDCGEWEYRHVILPKALYDNEIPEHMKDKLLCEEGWRSLGIIMSPGWVHYELHGPEPHIFLFKRMLSINN